MDLFFLLCAVAGGTILVLQVFLTVLGFGGDLVGDISDVPDVPDVGDVSETSGTASGQGQGLGKTLGNRLTFQTVVSFITFFGIGGLSAREFGGSAAVSLAVALGVGLVVTGLLGYAFTALRALQGSGSLRLSNAIGKSGRVYVRVPGHHGGTGKVTMTLQGRTVEALAVTPGPELRSGETVVVTKLADARTLEVVSQSAYVDKTASLAD